MKILNLEPEDYSPEAYNILLSIGDVMSGPFSRADLIKKIADVNALVVRLGHQIDFEVMSAAPELKVIITATTGLNHIDTEYAKSKNISVLSLRDETDFLSGIHATAEHTFALLLSLVRHIPFAHGSVLDGQWDRNPFKGRELSGKTMGIIGLGRLGRRVACYASAFGMKVIAYDTNKDALLEGVKNVTLQDVANHSDVVSVHIPSTSKNRHFINHTFFSKMKKGSYLINTSRGDVMCQSDLISSLSSGHLAGAALDVLEEEYDGSIQNSPILNFARKNKNIIITPHIGGATWESMHKTEIFVAKKFLSWASSL